MEFCPDCDNLLYLKIEDEDNNTSLTKKCYNCKFCRPVDMKSKDTNKCLYQNMNQVDKLQYYVAKKENLRYDPTIPHINVIPCPNQKCSSYSGDKNDIFYVSLNDDKQLYLYVCNNCMTHWTNENIGQ